MLARWAAGSALLASAVGGVAGVESSPWIATGGPPLIDRWPGDVEIACIEWVNAIRVDPAHTVDAILARARFALPLTVAPVDWQRCRSELLACRPAPRLVTDPALYVAARNHARYLLLHLASGPNETQGSPGFTGASPYARMSAAGYRGVSIGENQVVAGQLGAPWIAMLVDPGGGSGGMAPLRAQRTSLLDNRANEAGLAMVAKDGRQVVVMSYGRCYAPRLLGGVVYRDANRNGRYDPGEGVGGVRIDTSHEGSEAARSWPSGGLRLELADRMPFACTATHDGMTFTRAFDAGVEPAWLEWRLPLEGDRATIDRLIAAVEAARGVDRDRATIDLWYISRSCGRSSEHEGEIATLCQDAAAELGAAQRAVRAALYWQDAQRLASVLARRAPAYRDTAAVRWFADARRIAPVYRRAGAMAASLRGGAASAKARLAALERDLAQVATDLEAPEFVDLAGAIAGFLAAAHDQARTVQR
ncbi:MAG: CAP domain-containing protein [Planctomycetota bacterium]